MLLPKPWFIPLPKILNICLRPSQDSYIYQISKSHREINYSNIFFKRTSGTSSKVSLEVFIIFKLNSGDLVQLVKGQGGKEAEKGKIHISWSPVFQEDGMKSTQYLYAQKKKNPPKIITSPLGRKSERSEFKRQLQPLLDLGHHSDLGHVRGWPAGVHFLTHPETEARQDIKGSKDSSLGARSGPGSQ